MTKKQQLELFLQIMRNRYETKSFEINSQFDDQITISGAIRLDTIYQPSCIFEIAEMLQLHSYVTIGEDEDGRKIPLIIIF